MGDDRPSWLGPGYFQNEMPWDGSCYHRWINSSFYSFSPLEGWDQTCLLCGRCETWMYDNPYMMDGKKTLTEVKWSTRSKQ